MTEEQLPRYVPEDPLDLNLLLTDPEWGKQGSGPDLQIDANNLENYWGVLRFYGRDIRLSNLSSGEITYCTHYLDLATDLLKEGMKEPFILALGRVATVTETSQGRGGFLRKQNNTLTQEYKGVNGEPPKKSLMGGKKGAKE